MNNDLSSLMNFQPPCPHRVIGVVLMALVLAGPVGLVPARAQDAESPEPDAEEPAPEPVYRRIHLPVEGPFVHTDDFGDPRSGGRTHDGNDLMVEKGTPVLAAADARVRRLRLDDGDGGEGNMLVLRDPEGWEYWYLHLNNDTPGTDDGANPPEHAFAEGLEKGSEVEAGEVVAFAGDSGNAEEAGSHLHFELHHPDRGPVDPYPTLRLAQGLRHGDRCGFATNPPREPDPASGAGYWILTAAGDVLGFGDAEPLGSVAGLDLNGPVVGMAPMSFPDEEGADEEGGGNPGGYWLVAADGGIFSFGDARFHGSTGAMTLNQPIVGMASTPTGDGYWLVAADGGIFAFGDARFHGSTGDIELNQPIVGMAPTPAGPGAPHSPGGDGYWLVAADGGVFTFGDARFHGSTGDIELNQPIVGMAPVPAGAEGHDEDVEGYWLIAADGGIFAFGDSPFFGSLAGTGLCEPPGAAGFGASATGAGYWVAGDDGSVWAFGDAVDHGSPADDGIALDAAPRALVTLPPAPAETGDPPPSAAG